MSIRYVLQSPAGTQYDVSSGPHSAVVSDEIATIQSDVMNSDGEITVASIDISLSNEDDFWNDKLNNIDRFARWNEATQTGKWHLQIWQGANLAWHGDLAPKSYDYDGEERQFSLTFDGPLLRLTQYNAEKLIRAIPAESTMGTSTSVASGYLIDTGNTDLATDDKFNNHVLVDSAGTPFAILDTIGSLHKVTVSGTPAAGAYRIQPFAFSADYLVAPRIITSLGPSIATLLLEVGDELEYITVKPSGKTRGQKMEILETPSTPGSTLTAQQIKVRENLVGNITADCDMWCNTRWLRGKTVGECVAAALDHCGITSGLRTITYTPYLVGGVEQTIPLYDCKGKKISEAIQELCRMVGAIFFEVAGHWYFQDFSLDRPDSTSVKNIDALALVPEVIGAEWDQSSDMVSVKGVDGIEVRRGALEYGCDDYGIDSDFIKDVGWLRWIADKTWDLVGRKRRPIEILVRDDGTAYSHWMKVSRTVFGVLETYWIYGIDMPARAVETGEQSSFNLRLVRKDAPAPSTADQYEDTEVIDDTPPEPAEDLEIAATVNTWTPFRTLYPADRYPPYKIRWEVIDKVPIPHKRKLYAFRYHWLQNDAQGRLYAHIMTRWFDGDDRDSPVKGWHHHFPQEQADGYYYGYFYEKPQRKAWIDVTVLFKGGMLSAPSGPVPTWTTAPGEGDDIDSPDAPTLGTITSYKKDRKGTARVECDLTIPATHVACDEVEFSFQDPEGVTTKKIGSASQGIAGIFAMSCLDANVRGGAFDDVTFLTAHLLVVNQIVRYTCSGTHPIGGLTSGVNYYIEAIPTAYKATFKASLMSSRIDLTAPTGGDTHTFTPVFTTTAYFKALTRGDNITNIKARCVAAGKHGAWSSVQSIVAGGNTTAIAIPGAPTLAIHRRKRKMKVYITLNATDTAATKAACAKVKLWVAPRHTPISPEPENESSSWELFEPIDISKDAAAGKVKFHKWLHRDLEDEDANDTWKDEVCAAIVNYLEQESNYTFAGLDLSVEVNINAISGHDVTVTAQASGGSGTYSSYKFKWGDGTADPASGTFASVVHTYLNLGIYTIECEVTDNAGAVASGFIEISVGGIYSSGGVGIAGTGASEARSTSLNPPGSIAQTAWTNPTKIQAADNDYAYCDVPPLQYSQSLKATNFGRSVNTYQRGIAVTLNCKAATANKIRIAWAQLCYNGNPIGSPRTVETYWTTGENPIVIGGPGDLWGAVLTKAIVEHSTFGVLIGVYNEHLTSVVRASVDDVDLEPFSDTGL